MAGKLASNGAMQLPIGNTPLLTVLVRIGRRDAKINLKLESFNPCGSIKDRAAVALFDSVASRISASAGIIESTSGNLGVALAALCASSRVPFTAVVDPRTGITFRNRMVHLDATVIVVDQPDETGNYLLARIAEVKDRLLEQPNLIWPNQYENEANPLAHFLGTAPELEEQWSGDGLLCVPVSTGGTISGFLRFVHERRAPWRVVGVDVTGSIALGGTPGPRILSGIGSSRESSFVASGSVETVRVTAGEAVAGCVWLRSATGVLVGGSSGAAVAAAIDILAKDPDCHEATVLCPDGGDRYMDTIYAREWRSRQDFPESSLFTNIEVSGLKWSRLGKTSDVSALRARR